MKPKTAKPWRFLLPTLALIAAAAIAPYPAKAQQDLRTQAENSGFTQYTRYDSMMVYLNALQATTRDMRLSSYGSTWSGRELPYAIFARPMVTQPREAIASGKPIIVFQTNVHGGERTQRESIMIMMRELATPGTVLNRYLDDIVLIIAPQVNPDGFETGNNGTRGNQWGIDLNRDYIKLEQPEIHDLVTNIYHVWHPHMVIDGHNGGARPYNMNYITAHHPSVNQAIMDLNNNEIFQHVRVRNEAAGLKTFWYPGGNAEYWQGAPAYPRISMTYASFMNALGITFESPAQPMETGVRSGVISYTAVLEFVVDNSARVLATVQNARNETIRKGLTPGEKVAVAMRLVDHDYPVTYEIADPDNPGQFRTITNGKLRQKPEATATRDLPYAYILPREARDAVALLRKHNITVERLIQPISLPVQAYAIGDIRYRAEYDHQASPVVTVDSVFTITRQFPIGSFVVPTSQSMGRLVAHMLEAESDDNVILWNRMDAWLPMSRIHPVGRAGGAGGRGTGDADADAAAAAAAAAAAGRASGAAGGRGVGAGAGAGRGGAGDAGAGRGGAPGAGRGGAPQVQLPPLVPIFKLMERTPLPTVLVDQVR